MKKGLFVISLDLELIWGQLDQKDWKKYKKNVLQGRDAIFKILELFEKYDIHATWACVGFMAVESKTEIIEYFPNIKPQYLDRTKDTYQYIEVFGENEKEEPCCYGKSIMTEILKHPSQEIGTHTFSHYYCNEPGADSQSFKEDIEAARKMLWELYGVSVHSIILPRNQIIEEYISELIDTDICCVRGNARGYTPTNNKLLAFAQKIIRFADTYVPICGHQCNDVEEIQKGLYNIGASRFFRPYSSTFKILENLKIRRIKQQMLFAATNGKVFHLWWHPHNFGGNPSIMLEELEMILQYYRHLEDTYGMRSCNMYECKDRR